MASTFQTAVVTRATSTPGMACANHLANAGYGLILVDADRLRLNMLADALTTRTRQSVEVVAMDAGSATERRALIEKLAFDESIAFMVSIDDGPDGFIESLPIHSSDHTAAAPPAQRSDDPLLRETLGGLAARGRALDVFRVSVILF